MQYYICPLEGEKTLRYERTEATTRKQKEFIRQLRQENENLRKHLAETKAVSKAIRSQQTKHETCF